MPVDLDLAARVVSFMNEVAQADSEFVHEMIERRIPCNEILADHLSFLVGWNEESKTWEAGLLGLLNGMVGLYDDGPLKGRGAVSAGRDVSDGKSVYFFVDTPERRQPPPEQPQNDTA